MSTPIRGARILLEDATYLLFFLPSVNYTQLFLIGANPALLSMDMVVPGAAATSMVTSSFVFNYVSGDPDPEYVLIELCYLISYALMSISLVHSIVLLATNSPRDNWTSGVLLFVSGIAISLYGTHSLIGAGSRNYDHSL